jgi:transcriptional regulator with XRE-family HTH domain
MPHRTQRPPPELRRLGAALQAQRQARGVTQRDLAATLGISIAYVSLIERGRRNPPYTTVVELARALGTTVARLADDL